MLVPDHYTVMYMYNNTEYFDFGKTAYNQKGHLKRSRMVRLYLYSLAESQCREV